jgi:hypothetical protein
MTFRRTLERRGVYRKEANTFAGECNAYLIKKRQSIPKEGTS